MPSVKVTAAASMLAKRRPDCLAAAHRADGNLFISHNDLWSRTIPGVIRRDGPQSRDKRATL
jgi:hypothetical protein